MGEEAYDDETPVHAQERMAALERLVHGYYSERDSALYMSQLAADNREALQRRACELLDIDTEGP
jgi:hypothetical protein